jgi:hypothetical protein
MRWKIQFSSIINSVRCVCQTFQSSNQTQILTFILSGQSSNHQSLKIIIKMLSLILLSIMIFSKVQQTLSWKTISNSPGKTSMNKVRYSMLLPKHSSIEFKIKDKILFKLSKYQKAVRIFLSTPSKIQSFQDNKSWAFAL